MTFALIMKHKLALILLIICTVKRLCSQNDSIQLAEVAITATRSDKPISSIPMPVNLISAVQIKGPGLIRLNDVLAEQTGIRVVPQINGLGNGVQLQGLNPDYTLILLDGEPLIGRYTGTLDLNRITTGNIRKIEIVKGPSSSLYGSDALAGVINIITYDGLTNKVQMSTRYSSRNTLDLNAMCSSHLNKIRFSVHANHFRTDGYDLTPDIFGQTVAPYNNYTLHGKLSFTLSKNEELKLSYRLYKEFQKNSFQVISGDDSIRVTGKGKVDDQNLYLSYKRLFNSKFNLSFSNYLSQYHTSTDLQQLENQDLSFYKDNFKQLFVRPEAILGYHRNINHKFMLGLGFIQESIQSSRYGDDDKKTQSNSYGFMQYEYFKNRWDLTLGARIDNNTSYSTQLSPKLALQYTFNPSFLVRFSMGKGFKAPDFRQLYLNFRNDAASYSVYGTEVVNKELKILKEAGLLSEVFMNPDSENKINAESSWAYNLGTAYKLNSICKFDLNFFRNDLKDLIETVIVATTTQQKNIYSYTNLHRVFTQGLEFGVLLNLNSDFQISTGYQYLQAKDKDVLEKVKKGEIYGRDPISLETYRINKRDYIGLAGRSHHQLNTKLNLKIPKWSVESFIRVFYNSRFGINALNGNVSGISIPPSDVNGNAILDNYDKLVRGYFTCNASLSKNWNSKWILQVGAENLFNYKDAVHIPNLIGRNLFISLQYNFIKV